MFDHLSRRGVLRGLLTGLLTLLWPRGAAASPAACPHPVHQSLGAPRPGPGFRYRAGLHLLCPRCGAAVKQRGDFPGPVLAFCTLVWPPDSHPPAAPTAFYPDYDGCAEADGGLVACSVDDAYGRLVAQHDAGPGHGPLPHRGPARLDG